MDLMEISFVSCIHACTFRVSLSFQTDLMFFSAGEKTFTSLTSHFNKSDSTTLRHIWLLSINQLFHFSQA